MGERGREEVDSPVLDALLDSIEAPFRGESARRIQRPAEYRALEDGTEEVIVYSATAAKRALLRRLETLGYTDVEVGEGGTRYRSERPVTPYVEVFEDGRVEVQRSGRVKPAVLPNGDTMIPVISERKLRPDRVRVMEAIAFELSQWQLWGRAPGDEGGPARCAARLLVWTCLFVGWRCGPRGGGALPSQRDPRELGCADTGGGGAGERSVPLRGEGALPGRRLKFLQDLLRVSNIPEFRP